MLTYIIRRILYAIPIIIGVNLLTTVLFFYVNTPDDMARKILGEKNVTPAAIENWKEDHGYNLPAFINTKEKGASVATQTIFYQKSVPLLYLDFGRSDRNNVDIGKEVRHRMWASLAISIPMFILGIFADIVFAMLLAYYRTTYLDLAGVLV
ncbi:MAG: ABC transporter permease, partial [Deltaproteobacteria bacterium]|nr:ABC transporter permease [Deltaproteobacteria bacterium]